MARIRTIKPEFFTDAKVLSLTPLARLFYVSLWCESDRAGRLKWDPATLKFRYLPADRARVEDLAAELTTQKLIRLYQVGEQVYAEIPGFTKHQVINNREAESILPAYSDDACLTRESGDTDAASGKEGRKGREGKEGTTPVVPKGTAYSQEFEQFWNLYPEKVGKKSAWRAWQKAVDRPPIEQVLLALARYQQTKPADREWCHPSTWLNQGRWGDTPAAPVSGPENPAEPPPGVDAVEWFAKMHGIKPREIQH